MKHLIVIAAVFPGNYSGHAIALKTSIDSLYDQFDLISYIVVLGDTYRPKNANIWGKKICFYELGARRAPLGARFVRSLLRSSPAICSQYHSRPVVIRFRETFEQIVSAYGLPHHVLVEHLPAVSLLSHEQRSALANRLVIKSHDVLFDAFQTFSKEGNRFHRLCWKYELKKIYRYEHQLLKGNNRFCAITKVDALRYKEIYGTSYIDVLGVAIDVARFLGIAQGSPRNVVHIGGADIRKAHGLRKFVIEAWPIVKAELPESELIMVGQGSEAFATMGKGIQSFGIVDDERTYYGMGNVFVNPQEAGSGVKIKSLNAMAAGRALVSTANGVLGVEAVADRDYLLSVSPSDMARKIIRLINSPNECKALGDSGRKAVTQNYDISLIKRQYNKQFTEQTKY